MSGIDRVGGGHRPEGPEGPDRSERAAKKSGAEFTGRLDPAARSEAKAPAGDLSFPTLRDRILEGVDAELDREEILGRIVGDEVERTYGENGTPEMAKSVSETFRGNEQLWTLFNRIYTVAVEDRA